MMSEQATLRFEYDTLEIRVRARAAQPDASARESLGIEADDLVFDLGLEYRNAKSLGRSTPVDGELAVLNTTKLLEHLSLPEAYGNELVRQLLWSPKAKAYFDNSLSAARGAGRGMRISLELEPQSMPERLRWELMRVADGLMVGSSQELPFSRFLAASSQDFRPILPRDRTQLRALLAIATLPENNGRDLAPVDFELELATVEAGLTHILGGPKFRTLGSAERSFSLDELLSELRQGVDILYLVAHGRFASRGELPEPALLLGDDFEEDGRWARAKEIAGLIQGLLPEQLPRLVVLASCQGAGDERGMVHATLAGSLAAAGVPAVIGMQGFITATTVRLMMPVLFEELARDGRIDRALAVARDRCRVRPDAWMPALFTRLVDGRLWTTPSDEPQQPLTERLKKLFADRPIANISSENAPILFARDEQLETLLRAVRLARTGGPKVCVVLGDIGTGKSALVQELLTRALAEDPELVAIYSDNASTPLLQHDPYLVIQEMMVLLLGDIEEGRWPTPSEATCIERCRAMTIAHADDIVATAPMLLSSMTMKTSCIRQALAKGPDNIDGSKTVETSELLMEFSRLLSLLAGERPLLLIFENVQWIDRPSIAMLSDMLRRAAGAAITVVTTCRPAELSKDGQVHPFSSMLQSLRPSTATIVDLDEVPADGRAQLVDGLLDSEANVLSPEFREALLARTDGNPLFTMQLLGALKDRGDLLRDEQGRWQVSEHLDWHELPSGLKAAVGERLAYISPEQRQILDVASVDGLTFHVRAVAEILERKEIMLLPILAGQLSERHRLIEDRGRQWIGCQKLSVFRFIHPMVQQYLYDHLSESERRAYHAHVAMLHETLFADELDDVALILAYHYQEADEPLSAAKYWRMAAARATRLGASAEAITQLERGLALIRHLPKKQRKRPVLQLELDMDIDRAAALKVVDGWTAPTTVAAYDHARELAEQIGAHAELVPILFGLWAVELCRPELDKAAKLAARCCEIGEELKDPGIMLQALIARANTHFWRGEVQLSYEACAETLRLFDPVAHADHMIRYGQDPRSLAYLFMMPSLALLGRVDEARQQREQMLEIMRKLEHPFSLVLDLFGAAWLSWLLREFDDCRRWCDELISLCLPDKYPVYLGLGQIFLAGVEANQGTAADARERLQDAWNHRVSQMLVGHSVYRSIDAEIAWINGERDAAIEAIRDGQRFAEERGMRCYLPEMMRMEASFVQDHDPQQALELLERAIELASSLHLHLFEARAQTQLESLRAAMNAPNRAPA